MSQKIYLVVETIVSDRSSDGTFRQLVTTTIKGVYTSWWKAAKRRKEVIKRLEENDQRIERWEVDIKYIRNNDWQTDKIVSWKEVECNIDW